MQLGCSANVLDVGRIVKKCWERLPTRTIVGCWLHAKCLPHLPSELGPSENAHLFNQKAVADISQILSSLTITQATELEFPEYSEAMLHQWIHLESDPEIIASEEIELMGDISRECDMSSSAEEDVSFSPLCPAPMEIDTNVPNETELTLSEETIKCMLLKYASVAIRSAIKDPVLLALSEGIRSHLSTAI